MRTRFILMTLASLLSGPASAQADNCPVGQIRSVSSNLCIADLMYHYLGCLAKSGGGRIEISKEERTTNSSSKAVKVSVGGSGVVLSGAGSVEAQRSEANDAIRRITEKLGSDLAGICERLAMETVTSLSSGGYSQPMGPLLHGVGLDHSDIDAAGWLSVPSAEVCRDLCFKRADCKAMTYVLPNRSCWLKYEVPARSVNHTEISAIKN